MKSSSLILGLLTISSVVYIQGCPPPPAVDFLPGFLDLGLVNDLVTSLLINSLNFIISIMDLITITIDLLVQAKMRLVTLVNNAKAVVLTKINIVVAAVYAALNDGKVKEIDVTICVAPVTAALGALDLEIFDSCVSLNLIDGITVQYDKLSFLKDAILGCFAEVDVPSCLLKASKDALNVIGNITHKIAPLFDVIVKISAGCLDGLVGKLSTILDTLTIDMNTCLAAI